MEGTKKLDAFQHPCCLELLFLFIYSFLFIYLFIYLIIYLFIYLFIQDTFTIKYQVYNP